MARMIPSSIAPDAPKSEKAVFKALQNGLPKSWTVIHSKRFTLPAENGHSLIEGEVDFLVLDPERGYLGIEVKGATIERTEDGWFSTNNHGRHAIKDPGRQAQQAVHNISKFLSQQKSFQRPAGFFPFGWGVCFPEYRVPKGGLGAELPREIIIDLSDLSDMRKAIDRIFTARGLRGPGPSPALQRAFVEGLAPHFQLVPSLADRLDDELPQLVRLTAEQMGVLDMLGEARRVAVKGGAGTGKTLIAMELAHRLAVDGKRVLLLCFNRPLAEFLQKRINSLPDGKGNITVTNFHTLCDELTQKVGGTFEPPEERESQAEFWDSGSAALLDEALERLPDERFDAVIVDEGQDFKELWWVPVEKLLCDPAKSLLWVFYDPNQDIYGGVPTDALGLTPATLQLNCRNTANIALYTCHLIDRAPLLPTGTPEGLEVEHIACAGERGMVDAVRKTLHRLVTEGGLSTDRIMILSTRSLERSPVWKAQKLGNLRLVEHPTPPGPNEVQFTSLHRFKGLEADVVVLCDVEEGSRSSTPRHLYVGGSRARGVLVVVNYDRHIT